MIRNFYSEVNEFLKERGELISPEFTLEFRNGINIQF